MNGVSVITSWGGFASREMEEDFRKEALVQDIRSARFLCLITTVMVLTFLLIDSKLQRGTPFFLSLLGTRFVILTSTAALLLRLRYAITPQALDRWLLACSTVVLLMAFYSISARPLQMMSAMSVLVIVIASMLLPMRFSFQAWTTAILTLALMISFASNRPDSFMLFTNLAAQTLAIIVGLASSVRLHRTRREAFAARLAERETIGKLEAALAEVRTLEGILPICASCKMIRREDGGWAGLEAYISERTEARFSHGLCPECRVELYPEYPPCLQES